MLPRFQGAGCAPLADQDRLAAADKVARPEGGAGDDIAYFMEAHRRVSQRGHVATNRRGLLPAAAPQIVVDCVFSVVEFTGQEIFEGASPYRAREQVFANGCDDIFALEAGFLAGWHQMFFEDLLKPVGPTVAHRPFDQPIECMLARHVSARVILMIRRLYRGSRPQSNKRAASIRSRTAIAWAKSTALSGRPRPPATRRARSGHRALVIIIPRFQCCNGSGVGSGCRTISEVSRRGGFTDLMRVVGNTSTRSPRAIIIRRPLRAHRPVA